MRHKLCDVLLVEIRRRKKGKERVGSMPGVESDWSFVIVIVFVILICFTKKKRERKE